MILKVTSIFWAAWESASKLRDQPSRLDKDSIAPATRQTIFPCACIPTNISNARSVVMGLLLWSVALSYSIETDFGVRSKAILFLPPFCLCWLSNGKLRNNNRTRERISFPRGAGMSEFVGSL
jgi:hypothetical protein